MHLYISPSKKRQKPCIGQTPSSKTTHDLDTTSQGRSVTAAEMGVCLVVVCASLCVASVAVVVGVNQLEQLHRLSATTAHLRESLLLPPPAISDSAEGYKEQRADRDRRGSGVSHRKRATHFTLNYWREEGCLYEHCRDTCSDRGHNCWVQTGTEWDGVERFESPPGQSLVSDDSCRLRISEAGNYLVYAQVSFTTPSSSPITVDVMHHHAGAANILTRSRFEETDQESRRDNEVGVTPRRSLHLSRLQYLQGGDRLFLNITATGCVKVSTEAANTFIGLVKVGR